MITNIKKYIEVNTTTVTTEHFTYKTYNPPNTMYQVSEHVDALLLEMKPSTVMIWHGILLVLKRSKSPANAVTVYLKASMFDYHRHTYNTAIKELIRYRLLLATDVPFTYVVNIQCAHKLYKPK
jgi:hypothetical protein